MGLIIIRPLKIFTAGRMAKDKNFQTLFRALTLCPPWYSITIAGEGPALQPLIKLSKKLKIYDRCNFTGKLDREGMDWHYKNCDIYCQPSLVLDALPRTVLEAASYYKPSIISDRCGRLGFETVIPALDYKKWAKELIKVNGDKYKPSKEDLKLVEQSLKKTFSNRLTELLFGTEGSNFV